jgi:hypothetical protein
MEDTSKATEAPKRGRGRPKGSVNFVSVKMEDLVAAVNGKGKVTVHKKFAEALGLTYKEGSAADLVAKTLSSTQESESFVTTVTSVEAPEPEL